MKHKLSSFIKTNRKPFFGFSVVVVLLAVVVSVFVSYKHIDVDKSATKETNTPSSVEDNVVNHSDEESPNEESTDEQVPVTKPVETEVASSNPTASSTSNSSSPNNEGTSSIIINGSNPSKDDTTSQPSTQDFSNVTYDGHKPYEVFTSENGTKVYYDEYGRRCAAESLNATPNKNYDASKCYACNSADCKQSMSGYHCEVCDKDIPSLTCHPNSHYNASH